MRKREYQLINQYKSDLNITKEDNTNGNISNGCEIPVIVLNIITFEEQLFPVVSMGAASRFLGTSLTNVAAAIKKHYIIGGLYLVIKVDEIWSPEEILKAISAKSSRKAQRVIVTILDTGENKEFSSQSEAASFIGCAQASLSRALKRDPQIIIKNNIKYKVKNPPSVQYSSWFKGFIKTLMYK